MMSFVKQSGRRRHKDKPKRKIEITWQDVKNQRKQQGGRCFWFGTDLNPMDIFRPSYPLSMSVDRLDNEKDYLIDNIVICSRFANLGRGNCDVKTFAKVVRKLKK